MKYHFPTMTSIPQFLAFAAEVGTSSNDSDLEPLERALLLLLCAVSFAACGVLMYRDFRKKYQAELERLRGILGSQWEVIASEKCDPSHELYEEILHGEAYDVTFSPMCKRHNGTTSQWLFRFCGRIAGSSYYDGMKVAIERIDGRKLPRVRLLAKLPSISPFKSPKWFRENFPHESKTCMLETQSDEQQVRSLLPHLFRLGRRHDCLAAIETSGEYIACIGWSQTDDGGYRDVLKSLTKFSRDLKQFETSARS